jgi:hypothetical protein
VREETNQKLEVTGNWIQALGALVALGDGWDGPSSGGESYNTVGNLLQAIGNSLQAKGGVYQIENT